MYYCWCWRWYFVIIVNMIDSLLIGISVIDVIQPCVVRIPTYVLVVR